MDYATARPLIRSGDVIGVMSRKGPLAWITRAVMALSGGEPYTHVGVALWQAGRLYLVELNGGGNHLVPLSQIRARFDVARPLPAVEAEDVQIAVDFELETHVAYGVWSLLLIGLRRLFGQAPRAPWGLVCSGYVLSILRRLGWSPDGLHPMPAPDEVMRVAGEVVISVSPGVLNELRTGI